MIELQTELMTVLTAERKAGWLAELMTVLLVKLRRAVLMILGPLATTHTP